MRNKLGAAKSVPPLAVGCDAQASWLTSCLPHARPQWNGFDICCHTGPQTYEGMRMLELDYYACSNSAGPELSSGALQILRSADDQYLAVGDGAMELLQRDVEGRQSPFLDGALLE